MQPDTPKFKAWLAAEKAAHEAERELHAAMFQCSRYSGTPPLDQTVRSARALRMIANSLFDDAMHEMKDLAESLHHRRILETGTALHGAGARHQGPDAGNPASPVQDS